MSSSNASYSRILRLDGIRALAIAAVIASHHAMFESYGWAGVDLFFVLSGFLITTILRRTRTDSLYWEPFYIKRAFRILPPMFLLMIVTALTTHGWTVRGFLFYILFLGNVVDLTKYSIYLLGVLWSLAVEEHFYLVWPFAARFLDRTKLLTLAVVVVATEPAIRYFATFHTHHYFTMYELTPYRLDGLAAGAILSLIIENKGNVPLLRKYTPSLAVVSLAALIFLPARFQHFIREDNNAIFNAFGYTLVVVFCFAFVSWILVNEDIVLSKLLCLATASAYRRDKLWHVSLPSRSHVYSPQIPPCAA